ncbi:uncharacterized protein METZ01_LOCUS38351 [marine metagenome]|uniref:Uncharacterized protein n=1 Tax=marine metagenome TaxID=408172 RepID=A0A381R6K2_9ZZZZ
MAVVTEPIGRPGVQPQRHFLFRCYYAAQPFMETAAPLAMELMGPAPLDLISVGKAISTRTKSIGKSSNEADAQCRDSEPASPKKKLTPYLPM